MAVAKVAERAEYSAEHSVVYSAVRWAALMVENLVDWSAAKWEPETAVHLVGLKDPYLAACSVEQWVEPRVAEMEI